MNIERPDLTGVSPEILAYIERLEAEVARRTTRSRKARPATIEAPPEPSEPPTTVNVITISTAGMAKRTPRHLYGRQRRGGMGIFDLDTPEERATRAARHRGRKPKPHPLHRSRAAPTGCR